MSRIFATPFASVYPHYVTKAERKGRTKDEVDEVIRWPGRRRARRRSGPELVVRPRLRRMLAARSVAVVGALHLAGALPDPLDPQLAEPS